MFKNKFWSIKSVINKINPRKKHLIIEVDSKSIELTIKIDCQYINGGTPQIPKYILEELSNEIASLNKKEY